MLHLFCQVVPVNSAGSSSDVSGDWCSRDSPFGAGLHSTCFCRALLHTRVLCVFQLPAPY
ncbi:UNVERIFIED_CONTAM: hypothetical protein FKN15_026020 [Acipenser sinensis]